MYTRDVRHLYIDHDRASGSPDAGEKERREGGEGTNVEPRLVNVRLKAATGRYRNVRRDVELKANQGDPSKDLDIR